MEDVKSFVFYWEFIYLCSDVKLLL